jgi:hypothetical protein
VSESSLIFEERKLNEIQFKGTSSKSFFKIIANNFHTRHPLHIIKEMNYITSALALLCQGKANVIRHATVSFFVRGEL